MKKKNLVLFLAIALPVILSSQSVKKNSEVPSHADPGRILKIQEVLRITDEGGGFYFKRPAFVQEAEDGSIYVNDEEQLLKLSPEGKFIANLFKKGQGPGEITSYYFYVLDKGDLYVFDSMGMKIIHMDQQGNLIEEYKLKQRYSYFFGLYEGDFLLQGMDPSKTVRSGKIVEFPVNMVLVSPDGTVKQTSVDFIMKAYSEGSVMVTQSPLRHVLAADGYSIYIYNTPEYLIEKLDMRSGKVVLRFDRKYKRVKEPKRKPNPNSQIKLPEKEYSDDIVYLHTLGDSLLARTSTKNEDGDELYDLFNADGDFIDSFFLSVKGGILVGTTEDSFFVRESDEEGMICIVK